MKARFESLLQSVWGAVFFVLALLAVAFCGWRFKWEANVWENVILSMAVVIAFFSLRAIRKTERQKATLDFLNAYNASDVVINGAKILRESKNKYPSLTENEQLMVREFLNVFELLAIGLKNGIYDERMIMDAMETTIAKCYKKGQDCIDAVRDQENDVRDVAYEHFANLAEKISTRLKKPK